MRKKTYLKLIKYQTEQSRQHLGEVQSIYQEMRGYKHDFHHHLQTLKGQLESGETERALDAILSAKMAQAKAAGITVTTKANVPDNLLLSDLELSIVVGNLLDNAIEACAAAEGERFLRLFMGMKQKMLYFSMLNAAVPRLSKKGSRKHDAPRRHKIQSVLS